MVSKNIERVRIRKQNADPDPRKKGSDPDARENPHKISDHSDSICFYALWDSVAYNAMSRGR